ncbi:MerR family transcriptional regulator, partial [Leucobacter sp. M11]|uniref:MerR family transcriptional regulator n=1 Tax=Leucobacter sp. M11 TaxID=2993565 RepID=UPI002D7F6345
MKDNTPVAVDSAGFELLFSDGLPQLDQNIGYKGAEAARAAGISYRQLDYWARTELVEPTVRGA